MEATGAMGGLMRWGSAIALGLLLAFIVTVFAQRIRDVDEPVAGPPTSVLTSSLPGTWYPAEKSALTRTLNQYLAAADGKPIDDVHALIQPHAGYRYSGEVAAHGLQAVQGKAFGRVIVLGPTHYVPMKNLASLPDATHYRTPLGEVPLDTPAMHALLRHDCFRNIPEAHAGEHSVQIQVPLLQHIFDAFLLVPVVIGQVDDATVQHMARLLLEVVDANTLVVASTDFTHYGARFQFTPFEHDIPEQIRTLDMGAWEHIVRKDAAGFRDYCVSTRASVCGRNAVAVLLAMLPADDEWTLLEYDTSGRMGGDYSHSVSYLSAAARGVWPGERVGSRLSKPGALAPSRPGDTR